MEKELKEYIDDKVEREVDRHFSEIKEQIKEVHSFISGTRLDPESGLLVRIGKIELSVSEISEKLGQSETSYREIRDEIEKNTYLTTKNWETVVKVATLGGLVGLLYNAIKDYYS